MERVHHVGLARVPSLVVVVFVGELEHGIERGQIARTILAHLSLQGSVLLFDGILVGQGGRQARYSLFDTRRFWGH